MKRPWIEKKPSPKAPKRRLPREGSKRAQILEALREGPKSTTELRALLKLPKRPGGHNFVSAMRVLEAKRLVEEVEPAPPMNGSPPKRWRLVKAIRVSSEKGRGR